MPEGARSISGVDSLWQQKHISPVLSKAYIAAHVQTYIPTLWLSGHVVWGLFENGGFLKRYFPPSLTHPNLTSFLPPPPLQKRTNKQQLHFSGGTKCRPPPPPLFHWRNVAILQCFEVKEN